MVPRRCHYKPFKAIPEGLLEGTLEIILVADPLERLRHTTHLGVSPHPHPTNCCGTTVPHLGSTEGSQLMAIAASSTTAIDTDSRADTYTNMSWDVGKKSIPFKVNVIRYHAMFDAS